jgi:arginase
LNGLLASPQALGLDLTVYDPDLDPAGTGARHLADTLISSLTTRNS